jgi:hypothetical protein
MSSLLSESLSDRDDDQPSTVPLLSSALYPSPATLDIGEPYEEHHVRKTSLWWIWNSLAVP